MKHRNFREEKGDFALVMIIIGQDIDTTYWFTWLVLMMMTIHGNRLKNWIRMQVEC